MMLTMTAQTAWAYNVTYIDENGNQKTVMDAIVLNGGGATTLTGGLYVVTHDITYTGTVTLKNNVKIILMDGCTMNIGTSESRLSGKGFNYDTNQTLTIYGQTNGTGTLSVYTSGESNYAIYAGAITINGGTVTADTNGNNGDAIYAEAVTINGGHVTAHTAGSYAYAICSRIAAFTYNGGVVSAIADDTTSDESTRYNTPAIASGNYTFNWRSATDRITIGSTGLDFDPNAPAEYTPIATFSNPFSDGTTTYSGTLTGTQLSALANKTLQPAYTITYDLDGGSVATANPDSYTNESAAITLNNPTREGYTFAGWTGTGLDAATTTVTIAHGSTGDRSYTATWKKLLTNTDITVTIPTQEWTGSELTPTITVKDGETALTETTDYTVTLPSGRTNSGDYTVTLTGAGNYDGTATETFTITPKVLNAYGAINVCQDQNGTTAIIDGTSTATVSITSDVTVDHVTYNRTFTAGKSSTVMLPFGYTCNGSEGGKFYTFVGVEKEGTNWVATMKDTGGDANNVTTLTANTPYLFMPDGTALTFTGGATLNTTGGGGQQTADAGSNWTFKGTYAYREWIADGANSEEIGKAYGFAGKAKEGDGIAVGDFVRVASGAKIRPMGCYLLWSDTPNAAPARRMTRGASVDELPSRITVRLVGSNGETTGIGELDTKTGEISMDGWWTLDGIRLSGKPAKRGIYINNGRKIVVK